MAIEFLRHEGLHTTILKWTEKLETIRDVLDDAEEKQITETSIKRWLEKLEDLAYDVDDMLDVFATEALSQKQLVLEPESSTSKDLTRSLIPACCSSFSPSANGFKRIRSKIEEINQRLEDILDPRTILGLERTAGKTSAKTSQKPMVIDSRVYGRDDDRDKIIKLLLDDEATNKKYRVISIVGMSGVGKTTLAQLVYNHETVHQHFHSQAWVCVSNDYNIKKIMKTILRSVSPTASVSDDLSLSDIQIKLKETLTERKFLVVLDDVWKHKPTNWDVLRIPFGAGAQGSRVIVTTCGTKVASLMETDQNHCHYLNLLSKDDCWLLFKQYAFEKINIFEHQNLESIGKKIAEKCKGLPLAARTLGVILCSMREEKDWKTTLDSEIWDLQQNESDIFPALILRYHHLPPHLKRCFAYCSILPKDYEFSEKEIVLLWMAEGFLQQQREKQMEDLGHEYFHDLLSESFFQKSTSDTSLFVMHDLINDLAQWVAGEKCFMLGDNLESKKLRKISKRVRHSSYIRGQFDGIKKFEVFDEVEKLRTFLPLNQPHFGGDYLTNYVPSFLLPKLRCLRVLSLNQYRIVELPNSIGDLKHLRFLDLSCTSIRRLPESISTLYNLQTLILRDCSELKKLPEKLSNIFNLRHLDITGVDLLKDMPVGMDELKSLQTLTQFVVDEASGSRIRELGNLEHLRGTLHISGLQNVTDALDARDARLNDKKGVTVLEMNWWSFQFDGSRNESVEEKVLDMLQPHKNLEQLSILWYGGTRLPTWIGDPIALSHLLSLRLEDCEKCTSLPPNCEFPFLRELRFERCPKLSGKLPDHLPSLEKLDIYECEQLVVSILRLPKLHKLEIRKCQEVVLPRGTDGLSSLKSISLSYITKLLTHLTATEVENLTIEGCNEVTSLWGKEVGFLQNLTSLRHLKISSCPELVSLAEEEEQQGLPCTRLESLELNCCEHLEKLRRLHSLTSLRKLIITNCPRLESVAETDLPSTLGELLISDCPRLVSVAKTDLPSTLRELKISECSALKSLRFQKMRQCPEFASSVEQQQQQLGVPSKLESLKLCVSTLRELSIYYCHALKSLIFQKMRRCPEFASSVEQQQQQLGVPSKLESLQISSCDNLEELQVLPSIRRLSIESCNALKSLDPVMMHCSNNASLLEELDIKSCDSLTSLPSSSVELPATLKHLSVYKCPKLESVVERLHGNASLETIDIWSCESLKSLPEGLYSLNSLQQLSINNCAGIVSFPEEGFPTNLTLLKIENLKISKPVFDWGLQTLKSLRKLEIYGPWPDLVSFPEREKAIFLPISLTKLNIGRFPNLEYLSFNTLQSLTSLGIFDCPKLKSFPKDGLSLSSLKYLVINNCPKLKSFGSFPKNGLSLSSLEYLNINDCPKLESFPKEALPLSLLQLHISSCPLLKRRCKKDKGLDWPKIADIPCVVIDGSFIYKSPAW